MRSEISVLLDDELPPDAAGRTIDSLRQDAGLREVWKTYHLIGDALRQSTELSSGFSERVMAHLAQEPTVLAPRAVLPQRVMRFALPLAASLMGIGAVGWVALSLNATQSIQVVAAPRPAQVVASAIPTRASAGALKEYLVAHEAYSPSNRMQGVAPYVRTVSEIREGRRQ